MRQLLVRSFPLLALLAPLAAHAADPTGAADVFDVPARDPGILLHLEHRGPSGAKPKKPQPVLLVHGNFFPASSTFGVELPGGSMLAALADAGLSAYTLDLRGYGGSTRPAFMKAPIGPYVPFATVDEAQADIASALAFIAEREGVARVSLVGWSWGAALVGQFAGEHPEKVDKLVLYAPGWLKKQPPPPEPPAGNYRTLDRAASRARVLNGVPADRVEEIHPTEWFERWWQQNLQRDADGAQRTPPVVRAPSGVTHAGDDTWSKGIPAWAPEKVRASTLVVVGEWDRNTPVDDARNVHARLKRAASRELLIVPEATHFIVLEKSRGVLLGALTRFLTPSRKK